ncbi:hypothetical protein F441_21571, partial [Phytophthora nicotianae CJ01A1]
MESSLALHDHRPPPAPPDDGDTQEEKCNRACNGVIDLTTPMDTDERQPGTQGESLNTENQLSVQIPLTQPSELGTSQNEPNREDDNQPDPEPNGSDNESMAASSEPPVYDDADMEPLSFHEMYAYLKSQLKGLPLDQAKGVDCVEDYMQQLFTEVFENHTEEWLPPQRRHYPDLEPDELEKLLNLFLTDIKEPNADARKWRARLQTLTRSIYKSRSSLKETLDVLEKTTQAKPAPTVNPWARKLQQDTGSRRNAETGTAPSTYRFLKEVYSEEEITELRSICETRYRYPRNLRKPTAQEERIITGLVEGTILCPRLPDFLKRICNHQAFRRIQNTIRAQVEGDLILQLDPKFKIYPQFQNRKRLTSEFLLGIDNSANDTNKVITMLQEAKQICYEQGKHAIHLIFYTREAATKWGKEFSRLLFRNRHFPLQNAHEPVQDTATASGTRAERVWARQVGADGIPDEQPRDRYHVRLMNLSRFLDEAAIDEYIRTHFGGVYSTYQEPTIGDQILQTDTWDIFFKSPHCPEFLEGIRFLDWEGTKILVHHISRSPASPCFSCGGHGHMRPMCTVTDDFWRTHYCRTVTAADIATLSPQPSTITSVSELATLWEEEIRLERKHQPLSGSKTTKITTSEPTYLVQRNTAVHVKGLPRNQVAAPQWQIAGNPRRTPVQYDQKEGSPTKSRATAATENYRPTSKNMKTASTDNQPSQAEASQQGQTITAEVFNLCRQRTAEMAKQRERIDKQITEKRVEVPMAATERCRKVRIPTYPNKEVTANQVFEDCGIEEQQTPKTGNCQYYAVAMALLNRGFTTKADIAALESLTSKLKRGIEAAADHFFEEEFPHDVRAAFLGSLAIREKKEDPKRLPKLTEDQSRDELKSYIKELSRTSSKLESTLEYRYWGTDITMRMLAKILHRQIFLVAAPKGLAKAIYEIFDPADVKKNGESFSSVKERIFYSGQPRRWINELQKTCRSEAVQSSTPIVILLNGNHYSWLKFDTRMNTEEEDDMEIVTETPKGYHDASLTTIVEEDTAMEEVDVVEERDEPTEMEVIEAIGGERKEELLTFPTEGIAGQAPSTKRQLREADLSGSRTLDDWARKLDVEPSELHGQQNELQQITSTYTTSQTNSSADQESEWAPSPEKEDQSKKSSNSGSGRFNSEGLTLGTNRLREKALKQEWNRKAESWKTSTDASCPSLPATNAHWMEAVRTTPRELLQLLQDFSSPDYVLSTMTDAVLDEWTLETRRDCLT